MQSRRARRPDARVLPYVQVTGFDWAREPAESSKWLSSEQLRRLLNSIVTDASVQRRLDQANSGIDLNAFRVDQLRWACFGAAGAIGFGLIRVLAHEPIPVPIWFLFTLGAAFAGAMLRDYRLPARKPGVGSRSSPRNCPDSPSSSPSLWQLGWPRRVH